MSEQSVARQVAGGNLPPPAGPYLTKDMPHYQGAINTYVFPIHNGMGRAIGCVYAGFGDGRQTANLLRSAPELRDALETATNMLAAVPAPADALAGFRLLLDRVPEQYPLPPPEIHNEDLENTVAQLVEPEGEPTTHYAEVLRAMANQLDTWQSGRHTRVSKRLHRQLMKAFDAATELDKATAADEED